MLQHERHEGGQRRKTREINSKLLGVKNGVFGRHVQTVLPARMETRSMVIRETPNMGRVTPYMGRVTPNVGRGTPNVGRVTFYVVKVASGMGRVTPCVV